MERVTTHFSSGFKTPHKITVIVTGGIWSQIPNVNGESNSLLQKRIKTPD